MVTVLPSAHYPKEEIDLQNSIILSSFGLPDTVGYLNMDDAVLTPPSKVRRAAKTPA